MTEVNNLFQQDLVFIENVENQEEIFSLIGKELQEKELVNEEFVNALLNREKNHPTGIDLSPVSEGLPNAAIPHTETEYCIGRCIVFVKLEKAIKFYNMIAPDTKMDAKYLFFIINDQKENQTNVLSELMAFLTDADNVKALEELETEDELYKFLTEQTIKN